MAKRRKGAKLVEDPLSSDCYPVRNNANARERSRMRVLSKAFTVLKTTLPWVPPDTKLSKLDTLRLATCYIAHLRKILAEDNDEPCEEPASNESAHPLTLTWPYSIASRPVGQTAPPPMQQKPPPLTLLQQPKSEMDISPVS